MRGNSGDDSAGPGRGSVTDVIFGRPSRALRNHDMAHPYADLMTDPLGLPKSTIPYHTLALVQISTNHVRDTLLAKVETKV